MHKIVRNKLSGVQGNSVQLESKVLLAASQINFRFDSGIRSSVKEAANVAKEFWGKIINSSRKASIRISEAKLGRNTLGVTFGRANGQIEVNKRELNKGDLRSQSLLNDLMIHEVGHSLGLEHSGGTVMNAIINSSKTVTSSQKATLKSKGWIN
jgi:predicted Zn-dependent protease